MIEFFSMLFDTSSFSARWECGTWTAGHGWLHILSDLGIWSAYLAIPCVLSYFILRKRELPFRGIFILFVAFILACGTTHLMEAIIFWWPAYRFAGIIKLATALVSWGTVLALVPVMPTVLAMRTPQELEKEIAERKKVERDLDLRVRELEQALAEVKQLQKLLPICSYCKNVRDDENYWHQVEHYIFVHAGTRFSHGICPACWEKHVVSQLEGLPPGQPPPRND